MVVYARLVAGPCLAIFGALVTTRRNIPVTREGLERLRVELSDLKTRQRPEAAARIQQSREDSHGGRADGEGEETRTEQAFIEGRIRELEMVIANAELIDVEQAQQSDTVQLGSTVTVRLSRRRTDLKYMIVGPTEVDPSNGRVSDVSPVGKALLGARVGETVEVQAPAGLLKLRVKAID